VKTTDDHLEKNGDELGDTTRTTKKDVDGRKEGRTDGRTDGQTDWGLGALGHGARSLQRNEWREEHKVIVSINDLTSRRKNRVLVGDRCCIRAMTSEEGTTDI